MEIEEKISITARKENNVCLPELKREDNKE